MVVNNYLLGLVKTALDFVPQMGYTLGKEIKPVAKSAMIRARTEPGLKARAERIFHQLGLSCSEAINLFFAQVTLRKGMPFDVSVPNKTTLKAMKEVETGKALKAKDLRDLFKKLGI